MTAAVHYHERAFCLFEGCHVELVVSDCCMSIYGDGIGICFIIGRLTTVNHGNQGEGSCSAFRRGAQSKRMQRTICVPRTWRPSPELTL